MLNNGWIKLHRKIIDKGWYKNSKYVHLWIHLLLKANHKPREFLWNNKIMIINEGQLITGRKELSEQTGISETTIEHILALFVKERQIGQQTTTKFRLISVLNWKDYQNLDNRRTTNGQQTDTNKKYKNDNKYGQIKKTYPQTTANYPSEDYRNTSSYKKIAEEFANKFGAGIKPLYK